MFDTSVKYSFDKYRESKSESLFDEPWWFDAACPGAWDMCEIRRDNRLVASFAFHTFKKLGFRYIDMPGLTRTLEPHLYTNATKRVTVLQNNVSLLSDLLQALPQHDRFEICLPPETELALPFNLLGYRTTSTFSYRSAGKSVQVLWENMEQKTRNVVNAALRQFRVDFHHDFDRYLRLCHKSIKAQRGDKSDYATIQRIFEACAERYQTLIITAVSNDKQDVASAILVWDSTVVYFWQSTRDSTSGNSANSLLIWKSLEFATIMGRQFDLDGFISPQNGLFLAKFGLEPVVRPYVSNVNPLWNGLYGLKSLFSRGGDVAYR